MLAQKRPIKNIRYCKRRFGQQNYEKKRQALYSQKTWRTL